jgi:transposase-like protein
LSYRDLVALMNERGIGLAHKTLLRWVQHYTPEFEKRWKRYAGRWVAPDGWMRRTFGSKGEWLYLYRAVDKAGKTVDFLLEPEAGRECRQSVLA